MTNLEDIRPEIERLTRMVRACHMTRVGSWDTKTKTTRMTSALPLDPDALKDLETIEKVLKGEE